uniref:G-protein coupled receptors family 1 profile domain-containing protein n=1 Tax=Aquila chrysaetos chrysaetos TaxID=223781 RepID=A0A663E9F8_AQUCH
IHIQGVSISFLGSGTAAADAVSLGLPLRFSLGVLVLLAFLMVLLALVTILGNILVILAFIMDRNLRHRSNYFFLNLAISDFAVGAFCMPLYIPYALTGTWHLGRGLCKIWLVMDYLLCTASVFNIVLISYDRFLSVTKAVSYRAQQGITSNPVVKMVAIWVFALLLYCPAILFWEHVAGHSVVAADQCYAEFFDNWYFLLCASTLEFFVPLLSVAYFNVHIFHDIQRRQRHGSTQDCEPPRSSSLSWRFCFLKDFCLLMALFKSAAEVCICPDFASFWNLVFVFAGMMPG